MMKATNNPLPSLRSTLQKYGLQNLLNDNPQMFSPPSRQPHQAHRGVSLFHPSDALAQIHHGIAAHKVYQVDTVASKQQAISAAATAKDKRKRKRAQCKVPDCSRVVRDHYLCFNHGSRKTCKFENCLKCPLKGRLCSSHGGGRRCKISECGKMAQLGGKCYAHGGRCSYIACNNACKINGLCRKHFKPFAG